MLDEKNRLEIYRQCEGSKDDKVREINRIYQSLGSNDCEIRIKWCNGILIIRNFINYTRQKAACVLCRSNLKAKGLANSDIKTSIV